MARDMFGNENKTTATGLPTGVVAKAVGPGITGPWIDVRSTVGKTYPHRITAYGGFSADVVILERIDGDNTVAANVIQMTTLNSNDEFVLDAPTDYIRARTGANLSGTAQVLISTTA